jgi:MFS family permease
MRRLFRSLRSFNYRVWAAGALVSNIGTWMQRAAQDWLVLTQLTQHSASAVGIVMALQFGPQLLLMPWSGFAADHFNRRRLLMATQATMGALALILGLLTVTGLVQLWHVYVFAFLFGSSAALDAPVRQTFVAELVGDVDLSNAIALNSTSFNAARMIGPAVAGLVIASVGTGWAFLFNGASFIAVLTSLSLLRTSELRPNARAHRMKGSVMQGFHYVWSRSDLRATLIMLFLIGTFGLNFPIFISTMAVGVFHTDARGFGLLSSMMAIGTISRREPRAAALHLAAGRGCDLWPGLYAGGIGAELLAVRGRTRRHRRRRTDGHQHLERTDATLDRAGHEGTSDGTPAWRCAGRYADRRTDRRLGGRPPWSPLGTRRRSGRRLRGRDRRDHRAFSIRRRSLAPIIESIGLKRG